MKSYRYILEPYKGSNSRYPCPRCREPKTFVRYIDTLTGEHLEDHVGRCNREINCGYHFTPKEYFKATRPLFELFTKPFLSGGNNRPAYEGISDSSNLREKPPVSFIPVDTLKQSLSHYSENNLVQFLLNRFGGEITRDLIKKYFIGTSRHWQGATVFWQIDKNGNVRSGKIMLYDPSTGRRSKEACHSPTWVHKVLKLPEFNLQQCFFGEHLLCGSTKPVAIVESEKTALIASVYFPGVLWLACGSLNGLNAAKFRVLKGRQVVLFPDLGAHDKWQDKAREHSPFAPLMVSAFLEKRATNEEKEQGLDLADYLFEFSVSCRNQLD